MNKKTQIATIDDELLLGLSTGNREAFTKVYEQYYASLCVYAARILAIQTPGEEEDVVEEVFISLWKKQPYFESETHLSAFLYRSVKNASLNHLKLNRRNNARNTFFSEQQETDQEGEGAGAEYREVTRAEVLRTLHNAICTLPPQCKKIIRLGYLEGLSNPQIAEEMGLSVQTVKNQKLRGLALLRQRLPASKYMLLMLYFWSQLN